jgi:hypothetical protein
MRHGFDPRIDPARQPFRPNSSGVRLGVAVLELGRITHLPCCSAAQNRPDRPRERAFLVATEGRIGVVRKGDDGAAGALRLLTLEPYLARG